MFIEFAGPKFYDFPISKDRFKIRFLEPGSDLRLSVTLTYQDIDIALAEMKRVVAAIENVKANPNLLEYHGTSKG